MANRVKRLSVSAADRVELERRARSQTGPARDARRARIVLLAAEGRSGVEIAGRVGVSEPTVIKWRRAYAEHGLPGLADQPRSGRRARSPRSGGLRSGLSPSTRLLRSWG